MSCNDDRAFDDRRIHDSFPLLGFCYAAIPHTLPYPLGEECDAKHKWLLYWDRLGALQTFGNVTVHDGERAPSRLFYSAFTTSRRRHELNIVSAEHGQNISRGVLGMFDSATENVGRLEHCPSCGSRRALRNIYRCGDGHVFCEECAVAILRGTMRLLTTTCPGCRTETIDTIGFIEEGLLQA